MRSRFLSGLLPLMLVILFATFPPSPFSLYVETEPHSPGSVPPGAFQDLNDLLGVVGQRVPEFGGLFVCGPARDTLCVYLVQPADESMATQAISQVFGAEYILPGGVQVLNGQYRMSQLVEWYRVLNSRVLYIDGVVFTDISEGSNRLKVAVEDASLEPLIRQRLAEAGIPADAVIVEQTTRPVPF